MKFLLMLLNYVNPFKTYFDTWFRFELSPNFVESADDVICLHKMKKVYRAHYASKDKSNQNDCFNQNSWSN